jgi:hypothetical protein
MPLIDVMFTIGRFLAAEANPILAIITLLGLIVSFLLALRAALMAAQEAMQRKAQEQIDKIRKEVLDQRAESGLCGDNQVNQFLSATKNLKEALRPTSPPTLLANACRAYVTALFALFGCLPNGAAILMLLRSLLVAGISLMDLLNKYAKVIP